MVGLENHQQARGTSEKEHLSILQRLQPSQCAGYLCEGSTPLGACSG